MESPIIYQWFLDCVYEITQYFGMAKFDDQTLKWVFIQQYPLPKTFYHSSTSLLIETPGQNIENHAAYNFFTNLELMRLDGQHNKHLIDQEGYNLYKSLGYCRLSYHLNSFRPAYPIKDGDRLLDICQSLFHFLGKRW